MMTEDDDPMVLEHSLATRAREMKAAVYKNVVGMETSPPTLTDNLVSDNMSKHGDGARSEAALGEDFSLPMKPNEGSISSEIPFDNSTFSSPNLGNFEDIAGEGTAVAQKKRRNRGKNWTSKDTDELLRAVLNTNKACPRMEQGTASDSYWDAIGKAVPGRTGHECRGRMGTLKRSYSRTKNYCDGHGKEFKQLNEKDFGEVKVSPRLTEAWFHQIHL